ncbi:hypothetical protein Hanom_Chr03g00253001 [Helianthus anomalus]
MQMPHTYPSPSLLFDYWKPSNDSGRLDLATFSGQHTHTQPLSIRLELLPSPIESPATPTHLRSLRYRHANSPLTLQPTITEDDGVNVAAGNDD